MKANLSKIYWPNDVNLYAAMKRANKRAIARFTNHPYAVRLQKDGNDQIQIQTETPTSKSKARPHAVL